MNRLLETSHFKNSRRYPALLRFIVEDARGSGRVPANACSVYAFSIDLRITTPLTIQSYV